MGSSISSVFSNSDINGAIVILGLDASGKTTLLYKLKLGEVTSVPIIGVSMEEVQCKNLQFVTMDVGGRDHPKFNATLLNSKLKATQKPIKGFIFMVDSADSRLAESSEILTKYLELIPELAQVPMLILVNKQDLPNALTPVELFEKLSIYK